MATEEVDGGGGGSALACWAVTWSTRSAMVWKARPQPVLVQFMSAMTPAFGFQLTLQTGIRAGEDVLMEADLAVGPRRVWLARPPQVEHLPLDAGEETGR